MKVKNKVMPNEEQLKGFLEEGYDEPIFMVNLLKFKDKAEYPDKNHFCVFDELYSGTNPDEASSAAIKLLNYISTDNVNYILTTHYTKICKKVNKKYSKNYNQRNYYCCAKS